MPAKIAEQRQANRHDNEIELAPDHAANVAKEG
jgi:hypothetical protein